MTSSEEMTIARALREALSYESREIRIHRLMNSPYLDVRMMMNRLKLRGLVGEATIKEVFVVPGRKD